ncbi:MAG UNVERIFIED_CONTAM: hypothetical protein LVT10_24790 [Anaerolineae bacterium]
MSSIFPKLEVETFFNERDQTHNGDGIKVEAIPIQQIGVFMKVFYVGVNVKMICD